MALQPETANPTAIRSALERDGKYVPALFASAALQQRSERYVSEFLQRLRDVSVASRVNKAIGERMIMNAAFLVQRDREPAFDRRIKDIASNYDKLTFKYTGPWPQYNFVNIRLKLERAGQH